MEEVCVWLIKWLLLFYLKIIFIWKFLYLDDFFFMDKSGCWLILGLFDDYKVEGILRFFKSEVILGMYGVFSNKGKVLFLVVINFGSGVKKII